MNAILWLPWAIAALALIGLVAAVFRMGRKGPDPLLSDMLRAQSELTGRIAALQETQTRAQQDLAEQFQKQERAVAEKLDTRLADLGKRVGDQLTESREKTQKSIAEVTARLAVIDAAQKNIGALSEQVVSLREVLSNKQARGAFGEMQLNDLVTAILPPSAYDFQAAMTGAQGTPVRPDCLLKLPNPPGPIVIDAKFPLESYRALTDAESDEAARAASKQLTRDLRQHVDKIRDTYIIPGETAESALLFLPSEAIYAELHARHQDVVDYSYRAKVWIVSPTTLWATLHTIRAVLKDVRMREQAAVIQKEVAALTRDMELLDERIEKLAKHHGLMGKDIGEIQTSKQRIMRRGEKIEELQLEDGTAPDTPAPGDIAAFPAERPS